MTRLQHISLATILLMLSLNTISINDANASAISSKQKYPSLIQKQILAQAASEDSGSEDEMIDALEKRQKKN